MGIRICSKCDKIMQTGYCIGGGEDYYCSDKCLHTEMTKEEYLDLYDDGNGDSYYTEWEDDEDIEDDKIDIINSFNRNHFNEVHELDDDFYRLSNIIRELKEY